MDKEVRTKKKKKKKKEERKIRLNSESRCRILRS